MKQVAHFHADVFALAVRLKLDADGLSYGAAVALHPYLNKAMLWRAVNQRPVSVTSYLALCRALGLEPGDYLTVKAQENQAVTAIAKRETSGVPASAERAIPAREKLKGGAERLAP